jgi:hypothetical protein
MILNGFGVVAFFAGVRASSFCIHLFCPVCIQPVVHGVWSCLKQTLIFAQTGTTRLDKSIIFMQSIYR